MGNERMNTRGIDAHVWQQHAWVNRLQSVVLLLFMGGFLALLGWLLWGVFGIAVLLVLGIVAVAFNPSASPRWVMRMYGAARIGPERAPGLWAIVSRLAEGAGLPAVPELYYLPTRVLNAFAVGTREQAAIAVSDGLLRQLNERELVGVLAHEMSHLHTNDLWVMGLADLFSRATRALSLIGQFLLLVNLPLILLSAVAINWFAILLLIFAPTLSALAQLALSRTREYDADLNGARLTGDPEGLASALAKIERVQGGWLERIFMPGRRTPMPSLLRTHPDTEQRIARLMELKPALARADAPAWSRMGLDAHSVFGAPVTRAPRRHFNGLWY